MATVLFIMLPGPEVHVRFLSSGGGDFERPSTADPVIGSFTRVYAFVDFGGVRVVAVGSIALVVERRRPVDGKSRSSGFFGDCGMVNDADRM
jgi:hypothetical protein